MHLIRPSPFWIAPTSTFKINNLETLSSVFVCVDIPADSEDLCDRGHHRAVPVAGQRGRLQVREQAHLPPGLFSVSECGQNA